MSTKLKLSKWHSGDVKPVHKGVYERQDGVNLNVLCRWNGRHWFFMCHSVKEAQEEKRKSYSQLCKPWRGIVK